MVRFWPISTARLSKQSVREPFRTKGEKAKLKRLKVLNKITGYTGYTHAGMASPIISPTSSSRQCSCCNFSSVPSSVEAGRSASNSRCLAGLHFTPKFFPDIMKCNSYATLILSIASLLVATHGKSPQTCSCLLESGLSELASAKSCCSSWTFWAAAASAVRRDWTCQVNNKQRQTNLPNSAHRCNGLVIVTIFAPITIDSPPLLGVSRTDQQSPHATDEGWRRRLICHVQSAQHLDTFGPHSGWAWKCEKCQNDMELEQLSTSMHQKRAARVHMFVVKFLSFLSLNGSIWAYLHC